MAKRPGKKNLNLILDQSDFDEIARFASLGIIPPQISQFVKMLITRELVRLRKLNNGKEGAK